MGPASSFQGQSLSCCSPTGQGCRPPVCHVLSSSTPLLLQVFLPRLPFSLFLDKYGEFTFQASAQKAPPVQGVTPSQAQRLSLMPQAGTHVSQHPEHLALLSLPLRVPSELNPVRPAHNCQRSWSTARQWASLPCSKASTGSLTTQSQGQSPSPEL